MATNTTTTTTKRSNGAEPACMLRWVFQRGPEVLTCAVEKRGERSSFDVCVLPHWNLSHATIERFDAPASALRRHAEIASRLREAGWISYYGSSQGGDLAA
jgi:hypothetical protein